MGAQRLHRAAGLLGEGVALSLDEKLPLPDLNRLEFEKTYRL